MIELLEVKDRTPNPDLIALLERHLAGAKAGEIRSAIIVTSRNDDATGNYWAIDPRTWHQPLLGELVYVQNEFMLALSLTRDGGVLRDKL